MLLINAALLYFQTSETFEQTQNIQTQVAQPKRVMQLQKNQTIEKPYLEQVQSVEQHSELAESLINQL